MQSIKGFTIIELLVVVAIVGILTSVALPAYQEHIARGRITEATSALSGRRVQAEQYFQDTRTYVDTGGFVNQACVADTSGKFFNLSCSAGPTATTYTIQAVGKGPMANFTYTIDQTGARATTSVPSGWTTNTNCWVRSKDGSC